MLKIIYLVIFFTPHLIFSQISIIDGVPPYFWHHGCGPTSLGMIIGYYDSHGFPDLIPGDAWYQNSVVDSIIASPKHYADYCLPMDYPNNILPDKSELGGAHDADCLADFLKTSWSSEKLAYGHTLILNISNVSNVSSAFITYVEKVSQNYIASSSTIYMYDYSWIVYKTEIDREHPVMLLVDTDGDLDPEHLVVGIGYDEGLKTYACYNNYSDSLKWFPWRRTGIGIRYGIEHFIIFYISSGNEKPNVSRLSNNYPNPFNPITNISFRLDNSTYTELVIYNSLGEQINKLVNKFLIQGSYSIIWNGTNYPSSVYFYQLRTDYFVESKKMVLLR